MRSFDKKTLLVTCYFPSGLKVLKSLDLSFYDDIVVASENLEVHEKCKNINYITRTIFLNSSVIFSEVAPNVVRIIDQINSFFNEISKMGIYEKQLMFWNYIPEWGDTTLKVQEILIYLECAKNIFEEFAITDLLILEESNTLNEQVLIVYANSVYIPVHIKKKKNLFLKQLFRFKKDLKDHIRPIFYLAKTIRIKLFSPAIPKNIKNLKDIVLFQLPGSGQRSLDPFEFSLGEIKKIGLYPLFIAWGQYDALKKVSDKGHNIIALEKFLSFSSIIKSLIKQIQLVIKLVKIRKCFKKNHPIIFKQIRLNEFLWTYLNQYLKSVPCKNYLLKNTAERLNFKENIVAAWLFAPFYLNDSTVLAESFGNIGTYFVISTDHLGVSYYFKKTAQKYELFFSKYLNFVNGKSNAKVILDSFGIDENLIITAGACNHQLHFNNKKTISKASSFETLGITDAYEYYVLLDYGRELLGYHTIEVLLSMTKTSLDFIKDREDIALIIKPHHGATLDNLIVLLSQYEEGNIFLMDKDLPVHHLLNISDILITRYSTIGLEGLIYDTQIISYLLDNEGIFKIYGNTAEYVRDQKSLLCILNKVLRNRINFESWKKNFELKKEVFLKEYYSLEIGNSGKIIAEKLNDDIRKSVSG
jgi:hypothetical protein